MPPIRESFAGTRTVAPPPPHQACLLFGPSPLYPSRRPQRPGLPSHAPSSSPSFTHASPRRSPPPSRGTSGIASRFGGFRKCAGREEGGLWEGEQHVVLGPALFVQTHASCCISVNARCLAMLGRWIGVPRRFRAGRPVNQRDARLKPHPNVTSLPMCCRFDC